MADEDNITEPVPIDDTAVPTSADMYDNFYDLVSQRIFHYDSYEEMSNWERDYTRSFTTSFFQMANGVDGLNRTLEREGFDALPPQIKTLIRSITEGGVNPQGADAFIQDYVRMMHDLGPEHFEYHSVRYIELRGYKINSFVERAIASMVAQAEGDDLDQRWADEPDLLALHLSDFGNFTPNIQYLEMKKKFQEALLDRPGKFRDDTAPAAIAPWQMRIGGSTFLVPPLSVSVSQEFHTTSLTGGAIRQQNSPKTNIGHSDTNITVNLVFPTHESIWGFKGTSADLDFYNWDPEPFTIKSPVLGQSRVAGNTVPDEVIDYYLSSLRGLITEFKYSPILPIKNEYLNRTYGITAVALESMTLSTVEQFPFVVSVTLNLKKFNFQPYLPMIQTFDQAVHWGRFRQYMGRAAKALDAKVNEGFLMRREDWDYLSPSERRAAEQEGLGEYSTAVGSNTYILDKMRALQDGGNFRFFYPKTTPSRIFAPDTTDFRQEGENDVVTNDVWDFFLNKIGLDFRDAPEFDFFEYSNARHRSTSERELILDWLRINNIIHDEMNSDSLENFLDAQIERMYRDEGLTPEAEDLVRRTLILEWYHVVFNALVSSNDEIRKAHQNLAEDNKYKIREWNVPMEELFIDWDHCIVNGVAVNLMNNFAPMQIQGHEEPTYQHIGGGDSTVSVSMTVIGEENLIRFRRMFEHINGLARLEQGHGVLGFLGIKNVFTALCGIKYVLPLSMQIDTRDGFPHVYDVQMSFVDFDIMQQKREELDSTQQESLVEVFGKRNPFLRLKQLWHSFNAYPDMPLAVHDDDGNILGYMDPDWYFRSFVTRDRDTYEWGLDQNTVNIVNEYDRIINELNETRAFTPRDESEVFQTAKQIERLSDKKAELEIEIKRIYEDTGQLIPGWSMDSEGNVIRLEGSELESALEDVSEMRYHIGVFGEENETAAYLDFHNGGTFSLGVTDSNTGEDKKPLQFAMFREDLASRNAAGHSSLPETTSLSDYQHEYLEGDVSPNRQFETMMRDFDYRNLKGRMLRAFPTYMLWLIDEGGRFAGIKLFDNFYGLNSVIDFAVHQSENAIEDTLVLTLSNIYEKLTTPYNDTLIPEDSPIFETPIGKAIVTQENRTRNLIQGLTNELLELNNIRLKPGVRVHLRGGYGSNPNNLQTIFNGTIAEVQQGDVMTVICQSDAVELTGMVNSTDAKGHSGRLQGGINTGFWLSEPRDLIVRLLSMGSSYFKEWVAWGSKGVFFSESKFGIRHFGSILYEPLTENERKAHVKVQRGAFGAATMANPSSGQSAVSMQGLVGDAMTELAGLENITGLPGLIDGNLYQIAQLMWANSFSHRDYELFKRNIYPGNGTGVAQFMGGDMIDGALLIHRLDAVTGVEDGKKVFPDYFKHKNTPSIPDQLKTDAETIANQMQVEKIEKIWELYRYYGGQLAEIDGNSDDALIEALADPDTAEIDLESLRPEEREGLLEQLWENDFVRGLGLAGLTLAFGPGGIPLRIAASIFTSGLADKLNLEGLADRVGVGGLYDVADLLLDFRRPVNTLTKVASSPIGQVLGITSAISDDDLQGYDEVSFRAQTYMKTVWDIFQVCANLLPNYIIAVRPFEERSTVFYGKPHWLYTSGVIPVTHGLPKDLSTRPALEGPDETLKALVDIFAAHSSPESTLNRLLDEDGMLKDITEFAGVTDPYGIGDGSMPEDVIQANLALVEAFIQQHNIEGGSGTFEGRDIDDSTGLTREQIVEGLRNYDWRLYDADTINAALEDWKTLFYNLENNEPRYTMEQLLNRAVNYALYGEDSNYETPVLPEDSGVDNEDIWEDWLDDEPVDGHERFLEQMQEMQVAIPELEDLARTDPLAFAYQFGWKFSAVPAFIPMSSGVGYDQVGDLARRLYNQDYDSRIDSINDRDEQAIDIWRDLRSYDFRGRQELWDIWIQIFPFTGTEGGDAPIGDGPIQNLGDIELPDDLAEIAIGGDLGDAIDNTLEASTRTSRFNLMLDMFMRFLWQDPWNRAWVINNANRYQEGVWETVTGAVADAASRLPFVGDSEDANKWMWEYLDPIWEAFLRGEITFNENGVPQSSIARAEMERRNQPGTSAGNVIAGLLEGAGRWVDENLGQLLGVIGNTLTGFISSIRLSLMQMGNALSMSGDMQRQANILNSVFDDSIYYQAGTKGSILRMVDNPFTREYGEPVVEIREPFQRVHFISSFDHILNNGIKENLNGVATVVTATSDGKHPVRVHLDKGIPPDRQVEMTVDTGIYWDNAFGTGLFGIFHPLLHPFETARAYAKAALGASDELSSRRIALAHLKNSVKNIYTGEVIITGNTDIRPFDLVYIADVKERMYGMFEVQSVRHNFSPQTGFTTHITPNAIVTVNDPARWTMLSYAWSKLSSYNLKDNVRTAFNVSIDQALAQTTKEITADDVYRYFGVQMNGSIQYTQGNSALVRDIGAMYTGQGIDQLTNNVANADIFIGLGRGALTAGGVLVGSLFGPAGAAGFGAAGFVAGNLAWDAWQWVKDNLLDQHGCYIQFLNKNGQPMDAGLSYYQGLAVGTNHTVDLFPNILGITSPTINYRRDGNYRITTNDLLGALGWSEVDTLSLHRETSLYVDWINANILNAANRDAEVVSDSNAATVIARITEVIDGDTVWVEIVDGAGVLQTGAREKVRFRSVNTAELEYKGESVVLNDPESRAMQAYTYVANRFTNQSERVVAIRLDTNDLRDNTDSSRLLGVIFHNAPYGTPASKRGEVLREIASRLPLVPWDAFLDDGRPYTLNWEMVMTGLGNVYMVDSTWDSNWRENAIAD